jgi:ElaB/YqjD/DUF883 family membrane-anchored ribosome-binding protein
MDGSTLKAELDALRSELAQLRKPAAEPGEAPGAEAESPAEALSAGLGAQLAELNTLVKQMLDEAEETITEHPVATVAAALALGIVIGRLTAR